MKPHELRYTKSGLYCDAEDRIVYVEHADDLPVRFCPHCGAPIDPKPALEHGEASADA